MKNMEHYHKLLSRMDAMLSFAESKIGFIVAYIGLMLSVLGGQADRLQSLVQDPNKLIAYSTLILLLIILVNIVGLFIFVGKVLFPNLASSSHISLAYFGDINKLSEKDFLKAAKSRSENDMADDVLTEVHAISQIVAKKFKNIKTASMLLYPFTFLWVIGIAMLIVFSHAK